MDRLVLGQGGDRIEHVKNYENENFGIESKEEANSSDFRKIFITFLSKNHSDANL